MLLNTTTAGATTPTFGPKTNFGAGIRPYWVIAADLNADGRPDLVTANIDAGTISVRLNTTAAGAMTPTVGALTSFAAGAQPTSIAAADINGDGKPDLVVANEGNHDTISVLLNTTSGGAGTPSFGAPTMFAVSGNPYAIAAADINADGDVDVVVANAASSTVSVLLNTTAPGASQPTFRPKADFDVAQLPRSVAAADLNGDGKPDLMTTNIGTHTISVLLNTTAAGATTPSFGPQADLSVAREPWGIVAADTSGDGKPDLVSANSGADTVSVLVNTMTAGAATPSFSSRTDFPTGGGPYSVAAADFNADGRLDLATVNGNSVTGNTVSVLLNQSDSPPPGTPTPPPSGPNLVANPSFEVAGSTGEPTFWFQRQRATRDTSIRHSGDASLRLEGSASALEAPYTFQRPTVQAGQTYQLTAWVKTDNVSGIGVRVRYVQLTPVVRVWNSSAVDGTIDWTQVSQQLTLPAGFTSGRLDVYWNMRPGDRAWVDDVALVCLTCP
ncbi:MAG: VCBS repeat-containing protein [Chloroflexi bacterium]|nr:VCBS repeat-containing protein [Chloroflexota bacterium]